MKNWDWESILEIGIIVTLGGLIIASIILITLDAEDYGARVGDKIILESDTLTVVGSQFFGAKYSLSNGLKIDASYLESLEIIDND